MVFQKLQCEWFFHCVCSNENQVSRSLTVPEMLFLNYQREILYTYSRWFYFH